ncbi:MAG: alpha-galactosidase [Pirellulales bacterium]|nr:alpha-galactosidase [Pirellulales bacterium]
MTHYRSLFVVAATLLGVLLAPGLTAASPDEEAMAAKDAWVKQHIVESTPDGKNLPFSFQYDGRESSKFVPGWKCDKTAKPLDDVRTERVLAWTDPKTGLQVKLTAIDYKDSPSVEWLLHLTNTGAADTPIVEAIQPLYTTFASPAGLTLHHSLGDSNSADSFRPVAEAIGPRDRAPRAFAPVGGRSSDGFMPYFNLDRGDNGVIIAIGWAGQWRAGFAQGEDGRFHASAGQELTHFVLHPGETVRTPRILLTFWRGKDYLDGCNAFRRLVLAHYVPRRDGKPLFPPICASIAETAPDGTYEKPHVDVMPIYGKRGIEVFWFDMNPQHWYGDFPLATGTWEPDPKRLPNGLAPLGKAAHDAGMKFLLWFEPERVHPGTKIDKIHPEWVIPAAPNTGWSGLYRLHDMEARKWLTDYIDVQITAGGVDWIRWDFNVPPLGYWRGNDAPDRQGITEIQHVEGLYAMWQDLQRRHPGLLIDICASGGRRLDFETCSYGMPLWHSDMQCFGVNSVGDQLQNVGLWRWVPLHATAVFDLEPSYVFRSAMTAGAVVVAARNNRPAPAVPEAAEEVERTIKLFHKIRPYMLGDFYSLFAHDASEAAWYGYQFDRPDLGQGMAVLFRRPRCAEAEHTVALRGIDPAAEYEVSHEDSPARQTLKGEELARLKVAIPAAPGSAIVYYRRLGK